MDKKEQVIQRLKNVFAMLRMDCEKNDEPSVQEVVNFLNGKDGLRISSLDRVSLTLDTFVDLYNAESTLLATHDGNSWNMFVDAADLEQDCASEMIANLITEYLMTHDGNYDKLDDMLNQIKVKALEHIKE